MVRYWIIQTCSGMNAGPALSHHLIHQNLLLYQSSSQPHSNQTQTGEWAPQHEHGASFWITGHRNPAGFYLQSWSYKGNSDFLGLEMFDTQPQTGLNLCLDNYPSPASGMFPETLHLFHECWFKWHRNKQGIVTAKDTPALESTFSDGNTDREHWLWKLGRACSSPAMNDGFCPTWSGSRSMFVL